LTIAGGLGGNEIAGQLRQISPGIRLVVSTGYSEQSGEVIWDSRLNKPYTFDDLNSALAQALQLDRTG
jgi:hypothetical protein